MSLSPSLALCPFSLLCTVPLSLSSPLIPLSRWLSPLAHPPSIHPSSRYTSRICAVKGNAWLHNTRGERDREWRARGEFVSSSECTSRHRKLAKFYKCKLSLGASAPTLAATLVHSIFLSFLRYRNGNWTSSAAPPVFYLPLESRATIFDN